MARQRSVVVHGHFYQPPRENPWLETVEVQDSAAPAHDWNERVTEECYAPNTAARRLDEMDARGKKEVVPLEEIDARAVGPQLPEKPQKAAGAQRRQLTQQPLLTLAPPPDGEG